MSNYQPRDYKGMYNLLRAEKHLICVALKKYDSRTTQAAKLGISVRTLYNKIEKHQIDEQTKL